MRRYDSKDIKITINTSYAPTIYYKDNTIEITNKEYIEHLYEFITDDIIEKIIDRYMLENRKKFRNCSQSYRL